jgi:hypothetical protein
MVHKNNFPLAILAVAAGIEIFRLIRRPFSEAHGLSVWQRVLAEKYGELAKHVLMRAFAHWEGAPWWVILIVLAVAIAGNFVVPILGGILAGFLVLFGIEWLCSKDAKKVLTSMRGSLVGFAWGFVVRFATRLVMIGSWCVGVFS